MDRRKALLKMGMSMGYVVAAPTFLTILQSCKGEKEVSWMPTFFSQNQALILVNAIDAILPKTDTPSASEVNVHIFLDQFVNEVMEIKQQDQFKSTLDILAVDTLKASGKNEIKELTPEDIAPILRTALESPKDNKELSFVKNIRDLTIWAYKCNEYIGEEVLAYLPVPGQYVPCGTIEELTKGKAWSI
ncbi:gluconate 2-dehydrogenase subunit 3-like protein [Maribacter vaceletii]|uniref:Gluconate 2-dehydrogenase subunit 3-like protein n=1 Tax=Maribacter vaceletii TaxID=1206816 RepID=A0A495E5G4_9FLAO|nr:gluconate 2-dehydrogenase subunit 3 family protein [Maribacter vaceletii]RKR12162.1 gluconate 2-dehydrogenase subunit 3-like protein [Maribacter vaceletii]